LKFYHAIRWSLENFTQYRHTLSLCHPPTLLVAGEENGGEDDRNSRAKGEEMPGVIGIALLVVGVVLIIFGMNASASLGSRLSELFTGAPSDRTIWLLLAGVAAAIVGLGMILAGRRRTL
jgi:hypothetical protein